MTGLSAEGELTPSRLLWQSVLVAWINVRIVRLIDGHDLAVAGNAFLELVTNLAQRIFTRGTRPEKCDR